MPLTQTRTLTYHIRYVTITDDWGARIAVAEFDGDAEIRVFTVEATPEQCAPLLSAEPPTGQTLQQILGAAAYALVQAHLDAAAA